MNSSTSKLKQLSEKYRIVYNPDSSTAIDHLYDWMDKEALILTTKARDASMEEAYRLVNQANGIIKVREHIEQIKSANVANPNE